MPTYRYRCGKCGDEFEVWQSIKDEPLQSHDHGCGGELLKVLTPAGIVLKGSGFYKTDSRSGSRRRGTKTGDKAAGGAGDGDGAKRDDGGESGSTKPDPAATPAGDAGKSARQSEASSTTS
jgi:putative FmdB family regulatory protein